MSIALEVFCCSGGMAEGFRLAGIDFDLAFDKDDDACESYHRNLGHRPVQIDVHDLVRMAENGWRPDVWLLVADPPCTPWSSGGKREGLDDPRDCLRPTINLIRLLQPDCYLIGNVPGLEHAGNEGALEQTIGTLSRCGYCTADFVVLDAADFGVPQHRIRPFWFGHKRGTPCITWPARTHGPPTAKGELPGFELAPWVTAGAALADLPEAVLGRRCYVTEHGGAHANDVKLDAPARTQNGNPVLAELRLPLGGSGKSKTTSLDKPARVVDATGRRAGNVLKGHPRHPLSSPDAPARTVTAVQGGGAKGDVMAWLAERPSTTVTSDRGGRIGSPGRNETGKKAYYDNAIVLSELARARLQGFPDRWVFSGKTKKSRNAQIGMAMPPALAHAVAESIAAWRQACLAAAAEETA
jgi:site-specific DNA-cytosine methylase